MPSAWLFTRAPVKARSVPFSRRMWNCSGVRRERHSASLNSTLREAAWLSFATAAALKGPAAGISGIVDLLCFHYDANGRHQGQRRPLGRDVAEDSDFEPSASHRSFPETFRISVFV